MNDKKRKILISGYYGKDNFGDEAILQTLTGKLKTSNCDITVFSANPEKTSKLYSVNSVYSFNPFQCLYQILRCDIFVSGGGSLLQDVTGIKSLIYYLLLINFAIITGKEVVIFAQGLGPFLSKRGAFLVKYTLRRCKYISVRDNKSRYLLKKWGVNADLVCDPFFDLPIPKRNSQNRVGIQLRKTKNLNINYLKKLANFVVKNFSDKKIEIISCQDAFDLEVCRDFEKYLKDIDENLSTEIISNTPCEIIKEIATLDYMIAMRFHAVLTAVRYGIPTLALSYDMKVEKFAREFKIPCLQMKSTDDFELAFEQLKNVNSERLIELSESKKFDWSNLEKLICT